MPTILSHPAPVLCLGLACGRELVPWRLLAAGGVCAVLPDLDVIGFKFGVAYADILGHRGLSHSLLFALLTGMAGALAAPFLKAGRVISFAVCAGAVFLHILADAMTNGGLGVALFWPFSGTRYFLPWQPIEVSPFSPRRFLSRKGVQILQSEALWVWLPSIATGLALYLCRRVMRACKSQGD